MTTTTATIDTGSTLHEEVQRVVRSLAERDVYTMCNEMMGILNSHTYVDQERGPSLPTSDDLAPAMSRPDYSEAPDGYDVRQSNNGMFFWFDTTAAVNDCDRYHSEREAIVDAWEDSGDEPPHQGALQFWIVSDMLAQELEAVGALVARDVLGFNVWGRTECGTALEDDSDLRGVAAAMVLRTQARR